MQRVEWNKVDLIDPGGGGEGSRARGLSAPSIVHVVVYVVAVPLECAAAGHSEWHSANRAVCG